MSDEKLQVFGIDLGTTYSSIAYVDDSGRPVIVPNSEGKHVTPSVVQFSPNEIIVGDAAKNSAVVNLDATVELVKRFMGNKDKFFFAYEGENYAPEEISSFILKKLAQDAEQHTGMPVRDVVITCPAYFDVAQRTATANAGKIAGLNVLSIVNEPSAAAVYYAASHNYGSDSMEGETVLVYDLGGGTFDVTIIEIDTSGSNVVCTGGNHTLGGRDWDDIITNYIAEEWKSQTGSDEDLLASREAGQELLQKVEQAKHTLTGRDKADVFINHGGQRLKLTLTREKFDELTAGKLEETIAYTRHVIEDGRERGIEHIDKFLLVGGSSYMPQVKRRLMEEFDVEPQLHDPIEAVSKGAAIYGHRLMLKQALVDRIAELTGVSPEQVNLKQTPESVVSSAARDVGEELGVPAATIGSAARQGQVIVTSRSFGVVATDSVKRQEHVSNLVLTNEKLPTEVTQTFGTDEDNQPSALIQVMESISSERRINDPSSCTKLGEAELSIPRGLKRGHPIEITFKLNEQGLLTVHARELNENREITAVFTTQGIMSDDDVDAARGAHKGKLIT